MKNKEQQRTPCDVYSRINGYYSPLKAWNDGKISEWKNRVTFRKSK